jgi:phosphoribosylformylglycinamidine cyclo-ligase
VFSRVGGIAHITGGGITGNLVRILPPDTTAVIDSASWEWPPLFTLLMREGSVALDEMREVFNLGAGLMAVVPPADVDAVRAAATGGGVTTWVAGEVRAGTRGVRFR